jgi:hypothetical protein
MEQEYAGINEGKYCAGLFVDVMKAFDTVDHEVLLSRLYDAGVRGVAHRWFTSYLTGRSQSTKVEGHISDSAALPHGIPQGSVLSGPLFLIYVNNLCNGNFTGNLVSYADDTALFYQANTVEELKIKIQNDVNLLRYWFTNNFMSMSPKTKYIVFTLQRQYFFTSSLKYHEISCNSYNCLCSNIEQVKEIKYLGLILDENLSWKNHINYLKTKLIKYIRIMYLLKDVCNARLMRTIYYALINSKLEYGLAIWGGCYYTNLKPIIILQKCFIRITCNRHRLEHTDSLFKMLKVLPLRNLYIYKVLKIFFIRSGNEFNDDGQRSRRNILAPVPRPFLTAFKKFYSYLAPKFFNYLPRQLKEIRNRNKYLRQLKSFLLQNNVNIFYEDIS